MTDTFARTVGRKFPEVDTHHLPLCCLPLLRCCCVVVVVQAEQYLGSEVTGGQLIKGAQKFHEEKVRGGVLRFLKAMTSVVAYSSYSVRGVSKTGALTTRGSRRGVGKRHFFVHWTPPTGLRQST